MLWVTNISYYYYNLFGDRFFFHKQDPKSSTYIILRREGEEMHVNSIRNVSLKLVFPTLVVYFIWLVLCSI